MNVHGPFDVSLSKLESHAEGKHGIQLGRMAIAKTFHGPLSATSAGEMLTAMTPTKGSAGYVAVEQVVGSLNGKTGSFVLQHFGVMGNGQERLVLEVVPDSGTDELTGLRGTMTIIRDAGQHQYGFEYALNDGNA
jgi:hypothetical protein